MTHSQKLADLIRNGAVIVVIDNCEYVKHDSFRKGLLKITSTTHSAIVNNLRKTNQQNLVIKG